MKLEKIKLSGFKSFVDQTVIPISGNLTAIVGPNGCGKSNIIDAVRWVMGESSAKHLRGGSMVDVIFNGSSTRKPVSTASVELVFDNSEGKIGGEYAHYSSISIKRQVTRDGQSLFLLNGSRCRRKDITDIFLGTGLGSRSYAIIEQGTISRMVEAKPDDLRVHIEEAAGISKYKERRQETESRMRSTRENLERLEDLREEVEKQLKHLHRQAEKAEKYTELKKQERQFRLELLAMRWNNHHQAAQELDAQLQKIAGEHNRLFVLAREVEGQLEAKRSEHKAHQQQLGQTQSDYYHAVAEVGSLEQSIMHGKKRHEETTSELSRTRRMIEQSSSELESDMQQLDEIRAFLVSAEQELVLAEQRRDEVLHRLQEFQRKKQDWQQQWESYRTAHSRFKEQAEVQRVKLTHLENQDRQLQIRMDRLQAEQNELDHSRLHNDIEMLDSQIDMIEEQRLGFQNQLDDLTQQIGSHRQRLKQTHDALHGCRSEMHHVRGKITSLELLQQHAMGKDNKSLGDWLESMQLNGNTRLAEFLDVQSGWETAVEILLGSCLEAICLERIDPVMPGLRKLGDDSLALFETGARSGSSAWSGHFPPLLDKVSAPWDLSDLLAGIYCADDDDSARTMAKELRPYESVVTPEGDRYGPGWIRITRTKDGKAGVLQREKELRQLKQRLDELQNEVSAFEDTLEDTENRLKESEAGLSLIRQEDSRLGNELAAKSAELSAQSARMEQQQRRLGQVRHEIEAIIRESAENAEMSAEASTLQNQAEQYLLDQEGLKQRLESANEELTAGLLASEESVNESRRQVYVIQSRIESLRSSEASLIKQVERLRSQHQSSTQRILDLENKLTETLSPLADDQERLQALVENRNRLETRLKQQRQAQERIEHEITQLSEEQARFLGSMEKQKSLLDENRFELQESRVRQQTVNEQLHESDADPEQILTTLPEQAEEQRWKIKVDELTAQIERLGTINLTAIEEFRLQSERMDFLNAQRSDLNEALLTLEQAINKIDRESRLRFKETFDKINGGLQEKFPKLFGGGQAYLELTEQDMLESGVQIIARPPGKRNSSIHLLSGGEKALTAVALVFSIFELNPAPFCLLDEVDAPLDDANVGRFSKLVEEMSASVQFLYISHNKVTMEIAHQLAGVTMKEPGVSRMVAVDIEEAVSLADT
ncbi:MAG: chromosome segregation protein SMC [Gammaproteobacteria bacterium]